MLTDGMTLTRISSLAGNRDKFLETGAGVRALPGRRRPSPDHRRQQRPRHWSARDPSEIPGYPSGAARRIKKPTIGITVAGRDGEAAALPQINRQLPVDSSPPDREAGTAGAVFNGMEVPRSG
jgi:hypothetical protein